MANEIKLPELGEQLEGGEVVDVKVADGDVVTAGQPLLEVEAEKSTVEVPAPQAGRVSRLKVKKGDKITVGQTICFIEGKEDKTEGSAPQPKEEKKPAKQAEAVDKPAIKKQAEAAEKPVAASAKKEEGNGAQEKREADGKTADRSPIAVSAKTEGLALVPAGPATRRLARELGVDLQRVHGTGPHGRVSQEDVKAFVHQLATQPAQVAEAPPLPDFERWGPIERLALEPIRRRTAEQMSLAWRTIPHVTQHDVADITDLEALRKQQDAAGPKLTMTVIALKAVTAALKRFPRFNSSLDLTAGQVVLKRYYHIGVAVDTEHGLLVPVLRDVDRKSLRELAKELTELADLARQRKLSAEQMRGGTFTITNLGGIGGTAFTPIVNYPEVAILGMSRARQEPVVRGGQVVPRLMLPLSLSYDHRAIDGADAARFTRALCEMLENPLLML